MILRHSSRGYAAVGKRWTLTMGHLPDEQAKRIGDLLAALERARGGGVLDALSEWAEARLQLGEMAGSTALSLDEGPGDPGCRPAAYSTSVKIVPAKKRPG